MHRKLKWRLESTGSEIIYDDDHLLVLNKPANLLILPDRLKRELNNLYGILAEELGRAFIVHRIDKETSGIIMIGKTEETHAALIAQFEQRMVEEVYFGIVVGSLPAEVGRIDVPIAESGGETGLKRVNHHTGQDAVTEYRVLERFRGYSFLELRPRAGKMSQIRLHLQSVGVPLLSDRTYGDGRAFFLSQVKPGYKPDGDAKPLLERTALHAFAVSFDHPRTGGRTNLSAEMPKDMNSVLKYLRKFKA
jgi:23S rRNA pseudouridine1911/1915/1917 synthase